MTDREEKILIRPPVLYLIIAILAIMAAALFAYLGFGKYLLFSLTLVNILVIGVNLENNRRYLKKRMDILEERLLSKLDETNKNI